MKNKYEVQEDLTVIYLSSGEKVLIDSEDFDKVNAFGGTWCFSNDRKQYVSATKWHPREKGKTRKYDKILMHRLIMDPNDSEEVDHVNGNGLDNRKCNLKIVNHALNMQNLNKLPKHNKSGVLGVSWNKRNKCWMVQMNIDGRRRNLGSFDSLEEAALISQQARARILSNSKEHREIEVDKAIDIFKKGYANRSNKSTGIRNVTWMKDRGKWSVQVQKDKKKHHFGFYDDLEEAKRIAEQARIKLFNANE